MSDMEARIAVLETLMEQSQKTNAELSESVHDIQATLSGMREELAKYRGFWGGVMLVCGAVWAFFTLLWEPLAKKMGWGE